LQNKNLGFKNAILISQMLNQTDPKDHFYILSTLEKSCKNIRYYLLDNTNCSFLIVLF